jgi:hypothetical protein
MFPPVEMGLRQAAGFEFSIPAACFRQIEPKTNQEDAEFCRLLN